MSRGSECRLTSPPVDGDVEHTVVLTQVHLPPGVDITKTRVDTVDVILNHCLVNRAGPAVDSHTGRAWLTLIVTVSTADVSCLPIRYINCTGQEQQMPFDKEV